MQPPETVTLTEMSGTRMETNGAIRESGEFFLSRPNEEVATGVKKEALPLSSREKPCAKSYLIAYPVRMHTWPQILYAIADLINCVV
jgi:hypothetical protein